MHWTIRKLDSRQEQEIFLLYNAQTQPGGVVTLLFSG